MHDADWLAKAFMLSLIGHTSTCETAVCHSDWLYRLFVHVKIKHIDFYKWALWNKIIMFRVINLHMYECMHVRMYYQHCTLHSEKGNVIALPDVFSSIALVLLLHFMGQRWRFNPNFLIRHKQFVRVSCSLLPTLHSFRKDWMGS